MKANSQRVLTMLVAVCIANVACNVDADPPLPIRGFDAAIDHPSNGFIYFFKGNQYLRFRKGDGFVDTRRIGERGWSGIPDSVDAALVHPTNGKAYFFKGEKYYRYVFGEGFDGEGIIGADGWEGVPKNVDAAILHPDNRKAYFFKGSRYYRFSFEEDRVDTPNGRTISGSGEHDGWRGVPNSVQAAVYHPERECAYFFKANRYWRFNFEPDAVDQANKLVGEDGWGYSEATKYFWVKETRRHEEPPRGRGGSKSWRDPFQQDGLTVYDFAIRTISVRGGGDWWASDATQIAVETMVGVDGSTLAKLIEGPGSGKLRPRIEADGDVLIVNGTTTWQPVGGKGGNVEYEIAIFYVRKPYPQNLRRRFDVGAGIDGTFDEKVDKIKSNLESADW